MTTRSHLAIGEVLSLLRDEFPDVTISKIRFLESQGLVDPERTPSGYRKFYDHDVERLRWILLQQKEHFLPLKVIKDRLGDIDDSDDRHDLRTPGAGGAHFAHDAGEPGRHLVTDPTLFGPGAAPIPADPVGPEAPAAPLSSGLPAFESPAIDRPATDRPTIGTPARDVPTIGSPRSYPPPAPSGSAGQAEAEPGSPEPGSPDTENPESLHSGYDLGAVEPDPDGPDAPDHGVPDHDVPDHDVPDHGVPDHGVPEHDLPEQAGGEQAGGEQIAVEQSASKASAGKASAGQAGAGKEGAGLEGAEQGSRADLPKRGSGTVPPAPTVTTRRPPEGDPDTLTLEELAAAAGLELDGIEELRQFGLVAPVGAVGGTPYFDLAALQIARTAAAFARHGVEARHLRAWRNGADREASLFEQIVMPMLRQRNPQARQQAEATLDDLARLGADLREALLRHALSTIR